MSVTDLGGGASCLGVRLKWMQLCAMSPYDPEWHEREVLFPSLAEALAFASKQPADANRHFSLHARNPQ